MEPDHPEDADTWRTLLTLRSDDVATLTDMGHTAYASGQIEQALEHLTAALERDPWSR